MTDQRTNPPTGATVCPRDMWLMLLSMVRYALGRSTYIVGDAIEMVERYRDSLTPWQHEQIRREVRVAIEAAESVGKTVGMDCDHRRWARFVEAAS